MAAQTTPEAAERLMLRELAQTVPCPDCGQPAGEPCVNRVGEPLRKADHGNRLRDAERAAGGGR